MLLMRTLAKTLFRSKGWWDFKIRIWWAPRQSMKWALQLISLDRRTIQPIPNRSAEEACMKVHFLMWQIARSPQINSHLQNPITCSIPTQLLTRLLDSRCLVSSVSKPKLVVWIQRASSLWEYHKITEILNLPIKRLHSHLQQTEILWTSVLKITQLVLALVRTIHSSKD